MNIIEIADTRAKITIFKQQRDEKRNSHMKEIFDEAIKKLEDELNEDRVKRINKSNNQ